MSEAIKESSQAVQKTDRAAQAMGSLKIRKISTTLSYNCEVFMATIYKEFFLGDWCLYLH
jgi:hypothetical protein